MSAMRFDLQSSSNLDHKNAQNENGPDYRYPRAPTTVFNDSTDIILFYFSINNFVYGHFRVRGIVVGTIYVDVHGFGRRRSDVLAKPKLFRQGGRPLLSFRHILIHLQVMRSIYVHYVIYYKSRRNDRQNVLC